MQPKKKKSNVFAVIICSLFLFVGLLGFFAARWYLSVYGNLGFDSILYTLTVSMEGVESGLIIKFIKGAVLPALVCCVIASLFLFSPLKKCFVLSLFKREIKIYPFPKWFSVICSFVLSLTLLITSASRVDMISYIRCATATQSTFFEDNYVDPSDVNITFPERKQNLIYIYLESMETAFFSEELGGGNDINAIPELYTLAKENINFSHNDSVGGFSSLSGSTWTIGALVSTTAGVPLKTPFNIDGNSYGQGSFLPGITTLSNILHENGYYQTLMVGSDASYGGRKQYYMQHKTDKVYDLYTAREDGIIPSDYHVWWGMEDTHLFKYAKQELTKISKQEQPFAFSMLTVDTHHVAGYVCEYCGHQYDEQYENVLACSSKQVSEFVKWIMEQDFYENTTVIITGDHPTMDGGYIARNVSDDYVRKIYNCFINSKAATDNTKNREFCSLDIFPTTLAAIGCTIEGDRLGLGTNLFSKTPTLCEMFGTSELNDDIAKNSNYYNKNFLEVFA